MDQTKLNFKICHFTKNKHFKSPELNGTRCVSQHGYPRQHELPRHNQRHSIDLQHYIDL
jgi:hypothetical protein